MNASTWTLLLTGKVLGEAEEDAAGALHDAIKRAGHPRRGRAVDSRARTPVAAERHVLERHVCADTTAEGGNASLFAEAEV